MLHQIGSGVLGPVFRTYDPQHDRLVAVKAFRLDIPPQTVARLADALRRLVDRPLTHSAAVRVLDAGLEGTAAFVAMEYAPGESLDIALRSSGPWPIDRALSWLTAVAHAIDAAWAEGSGHGALHPRDILLSSDPPDVRVTGFGIAGALESIGERALVRRPYSAPERLSGQPWDVRADVYSLGVIAHEVLAGRRPAGPGEQDGVFAPGMPPETRVGLRRVLAAALAERPEDRFDRATTFVQTLGAAARGEVPAMPVQAAVPTPVATVAPASEPELPPKPETIPIEVEKADMGSFASEADSGSGLRESTPGVVLTPVEPPAEVRSKLLGSVTVPAPTPAVPLDEPLPRSTASAGEPPAPLERAARPIEPAAASPLRAPVRHQPAVSDSTSFRTWETPPERSRYPWLAIAAAVLAGIAIGAVAGYQFGLSRAPQAAHQSPPPASSSARADTDVPVGPPAGGDSSARPSPATEPPAVASPPAAAAPERPTTSDVQRTSAPRGRLLVRSVPTGALVFVDGRRLGETPATLRDLPLGSHTVEVARAGYVPQTEQVNLTASSPSRTLTMELKPGLPTDAPRTGSVFLDTRPRGARAIVDGRFVGLTPLSVPELSVGDHTVTFELAGVDPVTSKFTVKAGALARVAMTLK